MPTSLSQLPPPEIDPLRPTRVEVSLDRLADNLQTIRAHVGGARVMPVIKANAYGHGLLPVARRLVACGADMFGVAFLEEGLQLRRAGITTPILVFGGVNVEYIPIFLQHDLTLTAPSVDKLRSIDEAAAALGVRARVHLKVDTGMERIGVQWFNSETLLDAALHCTHTDVEGIYSHLANADAADLSHARLQLERFDEVLSFYSKRSLPPPLRHIANSAAILNLPESRFDMVRPGILLYGVYPSAECARSIGVQPALTWKSRVTYFKVLPAGEPVGYGSTWRSETPVRLVTIPVGYGDGYFRALSNLSEVLIRGQRYPVAGRVCMDQIMVSLGPDGTAYNGDEVVLLGAQGGETITPDELALHARTIPYEILTNINTRVPRLYTEAAPPHLRPHIPSRIPRTIEARSVIGKGG